ncbi:MAG: dolichyl-phosphate-mannose-protein mannosyltransferase [Solirubrobacteraceae bacterium]|jgi:4-amino-4-deoxy-L-arabinose transferase-like glycosyltransferase|nr:dolichyl-phosphate-mannose-protein mannosyltransferase [Solirubrobacteraceae bacterium]
MCTVAPGVIPSLRDTSRLPLILLAVISVLSFGARSALLGEPCQSPCTKASQHTLIFDEAYYVNAARVIAGIRPPSGAHYAEAPLGTDPNAEHPQLAKLIMAGAIELFGDGPFAWRIGSLFAGSIAILGMFALVRAAGGGPWTAVGASALMACDNLLLVHGRIGTLDIYAVAAMIWALTLYLRGKPLGAGLVLAIGSACKLVAPYLLAVLVFLEIARVVLRARDPAAPGDWRAGPALQRLFICGFSAAGVFMALLAVMDQIATPYNDAAAQLITGGAFAHFGHMVSYANSLVSPHGPQGIASYPWDWLVDFKPITYLRINPSLPGDGLYAIHPVSKFLGFVSPPVLAAGVLALPVALWRFVRPPRPSGARQPVTPHPLRVTGDTELAVVGLSWFLGTWLPFAALSLIDQRTSYLYYMVVVMPGLYVTGAWLVARLWRLRRIWLRALIGLWALSVVVAVVLLYPFVPVF